MSLKYSVLRGVGAIRKSGAIRFAKNTAIGAASGYVAGRVVSPAGLAKEGGHTGAVTGAIVGGALGLPHLKLARGVAKEASVYARGLKATPGSKLGAALKGMEKSASDMRVVFRRIRGRIVPVKVK